VLLQAKFVVQAAGATKKLKSAGKNAIKSVKRNLPSKLPTKLPNKPGKALKKAAKGSGDGWYGPDRALFLGKTSPSLQSPSPLALGLPLPIPTAILKSRRKGSI
jgi:hypothetical protein